MPIEDQILPQQFNISSNKISIKKIVNRTAKSTPWNVQNKTQSRNHSHEYRKSQTSCLNGESFTKTTNDLGQSLADGQLKSSLSIGASRIFFTYNKMSLNGNNPINNFKTVDLVNNKNTYNPEEIKGKTSQKRQKKDAVKNVIEQQKQQGENLQPSSQINKSQNKQITVTRAFQDANRHKHYRAATAIEGSAAMGNFSFGQQQRAYFMSKLKNEILSKQKNSQTIKELKQSLFQLSSQNNENTPLQIKTLVQENHVNRDPPQANRSISSKQGIFQYMRKAQTLNQDINLSESEQSIVIDNFQSYIDRLGIRKRKKTVNSRNSDF